MPIKKKVKLVKLKLFLIIVDKNLLYLISFRKKTYILKQFNYKIIEIIHNIIFYKNAIPVNAS